MIYLSPNNSLQIMTLNNDPFTSFECNAQIVETNGKKIAKMELPTEFQGHTFAVDFQRHDKCQILRSPFRIEYVLCNGFEIYLNDLGAVDPASGFSNLRVTPKLSTVELKLHYICDGESSKKISQMSLKTKDGLVQRLVIIVPEDDISIAIKRSNLFVSGILDSICFRKQIPLDICSIEIFQQDTGELLRRYVTLPYFSDVYLDEADMLIASKTPKVIIPCLRLFREAINSTSPHYRLLCLYRAKEGLEIIQAANAKKLEESGIVFKRQDRRIPNIKLTKEYFPKLIGKRFNAFFDYVYAKCRIPIAHLKWDDLENMLLDPTDVRTDHRIDYTNALLILIVKQMIQDEWEFIKNIIYISRGFCVRANSIAGSSTSWPGPPMATACARCGLWAGLCSSSCWAAPSSSSPRTSADQRFRSPPEIDCAPFAAKTARRKQARSPSWRPSYSAPPTSPLVPAPSFPLC